MQGSGGGGGSTCNTEIVAEVVHRPGSAPFRRHRPRSISSMPDEWLGRVEILPNPLSWCIPACATSCAGAASPSPGQENEEPSLLEGTPWNCRVVLALTSCGQRAETRLSRVVKLSWPQTWLISLSCDQWDRGRLFSGYKKRRLDGCSRSQKLSCDGHSPPAGR